MGLVLGIAAVSLAVAALAQLTTSSKVRRLAVGLFGRALPGARTGDPEAADAARTSVTARLEWTEVANLTAAKVATRPDRARTSHPDPETASSSTAVELRR